MNSRWSKWGVLYMLWGTSHDHLLERSIASLKLYHPDLPIQVHRVQTTSHEESMSHAMLLEKSRMLAISPFENTLFLDADTMVMGRLDFALEKAERYGLACCICECPWAQRYTGLKHENDLIEYNTGVLFFTRLAEPVFYCWEKLARTIDSSIYHVKDGVPSVMHHNDQASFAKAVDMTGYNPFILPFNWNFRAFCQRTFFGPIRIWHDISAPPRELYELNRYYTQPDALMHHYSLD